MKQQSNVELKARLASLDAARQVAKRLATRQLPTEHQIDTYFHCQQGRLKLREINDQRAELIAYRRPDQQTSRQSYYAIAEIPQPAVVKALLASALGVRQTVDKIREIFLYENVRIHLDQVQDLGDFLEFEAVLADDSNADEGHRQLDWLGREFAVRPADVVAGSYGDR